MMNFNATFAHERSLEFGRQYIADAVGAGLARTLEVGPGVLSVGG